MQNNYTHSFHPYPAKFPGNIIRKYIIKYSKENDCVIDPFCGSGTTLVEASILNRNSLGIDINPVGTLISETKTQKYSKKDLELILIIISELEKALLAPEQWIKNNYSDALPRYENRDYWFSDQVINELNSIKSSIVDNCEKKNRKIYMLLLTAFSRIIVLVSNQDTETRYAKIDKNIKVGEPLKLFLRTLRSYYETLTKSDLLNVRGAVEVIEGDSLVELPKIKDDSFDFAITSPLYINSFDYYLYHKHRIFLLNKSPKLLRKIEIGGHHTIDSQSYEFALSQYKNAISQTFSNLNRILKPQAKFVIFIGDGVVKGKLINSAKLTIEIAKDTGFKLLEKETVPLREVSRVFIKDKKIEKKKHHILTFINVK